MQDEPGATALLASVIRFLRDEALPALPPRQAFHARVAANALDIVMREITIGRAAELDELARLGALVGETGTLAERNARLALAIRDATLDPADPAVRDHVWATTLEKLAVDQPRYSGYVRALAERSGTNGET
jgi:hypothetical protein